MDADDFLELAAHFDRAMTEAINAQNDDAISAALQRWFEVAPVAAKQWAQSYFANPKNGEDMTSGDALIDIASVAAKADPQWALEHLLLKKEPSFADPNRALLEAVARQDPALAREWMKKPGNAAYRKSVLPGFIEGLAERDPLSAMDAALAEAPSERGELFNIVTSEAAKSGSALARATLAKIPDKETRRNATMKAMEILATDTVSDPFAFLQDQMGAEFSKFDPKDLKSGSTAWKEAIESDPSAAAKWAMSVQGGDHEGILHSVLDAWSLSDEPGFNAWIMAQQARNADQPNEQRDAALADAQLIAANKLCSDGNVAAAVEMAAKTGPLASAELTERLAEKLTRQDPTLAAKLAASRPPGPSREKMDEQIGRDWMARDPQEAANWIQSLPAGADRDAAVKGLAASAQREDPPRAAEWVAEIADPDQRKSAAESLVYSWQNRDPAAAREWLTSLEGVDVNWKAKMLRRLR